MPPPQLNRFPSGPTTISPYHQQFPTHAQGHPTHQGPMGAAAQPYIANPQINPFPNPTNGGLVIPGMNGAFNTGMDGPRLAFQGNFPQPHGQHAHSLSVDYPQATRSQPNKGRIREVWKHNLAEEVAVLRSLVDKYPYIAMDTEFPGVVARPMGNFRGKSDYHYQCLRVNVDLLKVIQIGIALFNEDGESPPARPTSDDATDLGAGSKRGNGPLPCAWQFNFKFSLKDDMYNEKSIESLQSAGIDFNVLERDGIDPQEFAAMLIPSGLVCFEEVKWISFHGGYDFGYLTKLLLGGQLLANDEHDFTSTMQKYFPAIYDVKHLLKNAIRRQQCGILAITDAGVPDILQKFEHKGSLESIAESLKVKRVGAAHQAGSDALITGRVFFTMRERIWNHEIPEDQIGRVWGLWVPDNPLTLTDWGKQGYGGQENPYASPAQGTNGAPGQNGGPTTPGTTTASLATAGTAGTPSAQSHNTNGTAAIGPMTPGGGGGVFGNFAFPGASR